MKIRATIAVICALSLTACATPYQEMGAMGGVAADQISPDTFRIVARGNGYTEQRLVQDYVLLKAAETARQHGQTHFAILGLQDVSSSSSMSFGSTSGTFNRGGFSGYGSGFTENIIKPGQDVMVRIFTPPPNSPTPPGSFSVADILQYVSPRVKRA